jgi:hypothetical protein
VAFHFAMIVCGVAAWLRLSRKEPADALRFAIVFLGSTAYFAVAMMLTQPRYLSIFPRLLHPELHV